MENLKTVKTLFTLVAMAFSVAVTSCEKEEVAKETKFGKVITTPISQTKGGGDEEEEPFIDGLVENANGVGVAMAEVKLFEAGSSNVLQTETTDINGKFSMTVAAGTYYFKVTLLGTTTTTNNFVISQDTQVTIVI